MALQREAIRKRKPCPGWGPHPNPPDSGRRQPVRLLNVRAARAWNASAKEPSEQQRTAPFFHRVWYHGTVHVRMLCVQRVHHGGRPNTIHDGRSARAGRVRCGAAALRGGERGALRRGGVGAIAGPRELESALLEADDAVADVLGVRVHGMMYESRWNHPRTSLGGKNVWPDQGHLCSYDSILGCGRYFIPAMFVCLFACC